MTYNTHYMYVPNDRKHAFKQHLLRMQPGALLVLDEPGFAIEMSRALPNTKVIYRKWYPPHHSDGDNNVHTRVSDPKELLNVYSSEIPSGEKVYLHFGNEPGANDYLFDWSEAAARYTEEAKRYGVYCNFSVGTPEQASWRTVSARRFLKRITDNPARHLLGIHEYIPTLVNQEFGLLTNPASWPQRITQPSYLIGRYRYLFEVCKEFSIPRPRIVMTEYGFDYIHAVKDWQQSLPKTPGKPDLGALWRNIEAWKQAMPSGWTWQQYMVEQLNWVWRAVYRGDGIEGICLYCYGSQGYWIDYDHKDVPDLFPLMESKDWSRMTVTTPPPAPAATPNAWVNGTSAAVNVRSTPNGAVVRVIDDKGELANVDGFETAGDYIWYRYTFLNGVKGWIRADVHRWVELTPSEELLDAPYYSQNDADSNIYPNDCGPAALAPMMAYVGRKYTVNDIARRAGMVGSEFSSFQQLITAAKSYTFEAMHKRPFLLSDIIASLIDGFPVLSLVNYAQLKPGKNYGHFVTVVGYKLVGQVLSIAIHDPNDAANVWYPAAQFARAIAYEGSTANMPFQSLIFTNWKDFEQPKDPPPPTPEGDSPVLFHAENLLVKARGEIDEVITAIRELRANVT